MTSSALAMGVSGLMVSARTCARSVITLILISSMTVGIFDGDQNRPYLFAFILCFTRGQAITLVASMRQFGVVAWTYL
jgi:hypothetical protein